MDEQDKLTKGLLDIFRKKMPNASPYALEQLAIEAEKNPITAAVIPADWRSMDIQGRVNGVSYNSYGQSENGYEMADNALSAASQGSANPLTYEKVKQAMEEAQKIVDEQFSRNVFAPNQTVTTTRSFGPPTTMAYIPAGFTFAQGQARPSMMPKQLETVKSGGKRSIILDGDV